MIDEIPEIESENFKLCFIIDVLIGEEFRYNRAWWKKSSWLEADLTDNNDPHDPNIANLNSWIHLGKIMYKLCAVEALSLSGEYDDG